MESVTFPAWTNKLRPVLVVGLLGAPLFLVTLVGYGASPRTTDVGYAPIQPVPFSHALHAGELGMDCRYCHTTVDQAAFAAVPPTATCMNCHSDKGVHTESEKLRPLREAHAAGEALPWKKVHDLPDHAYFNHAAHIQSGVSCVSCHGRIDTMEVVTQVEPLSMGWCIECHRNPEPHLRPVEFVTDLDWQPAEGVDPIEMGKRLRQEKNINPSTDCSTCHR